MTSKPVSYRIEIYPVVGLNPNDILGYKWRLVNANTGDPLCQSPQGYDTPEKSYIEATQAKWIMMDEGLKTALINLDGNCMPENEVYKNETKGD